jgi:hypothetical protein
VEDEQVDDGGDDICGGMCGLVSIISYLDLGSNLMRHTPDGINNSPTTR